MLKLRRLQLTICQHLVYLTIAPSNGGTICVVISGVLKKVYPCRQVCRSFIALALSGHFYAVLNSNTY